MEKDRNFGFSENHQERSPRWSLRRNLLALHPRGEKLEEFKNYIVFLSGF